MDQQLNKLLIRQIRRYFGSVENLPPEFRKMVEDINETYQGYEEDFRLLQNSIEISSQELRDAFLRQKQDAEVQKETIRKINQAIRVLNPADKHLPAHPGEMPADSNYLIDSLISLIGERNRAEEALRQSEFRMTSLTSTAQDAILMMDSDGQISFWNSAAERIFGYSSGEAIGQDLHLFFAPEVYHTAQKAAFPEFQKSGKGAAIGQTLDLKALTKDGREIAVQLSLSSFELQDGWHAVGILRDITERRKMEDQLKESENLQRSLLENVAVGIVIIDPETRVIERVNSYAAQLIGEAKEQIVGQKCHQYLCPTEEESCLACDSGLDEDNSDRLLLRANKSELPVLKTVKRIQIGGKERLLESFVDISVQKAAEEALQNERALFRTIIDLIPDAVYVKDTDGRKILANPKEVELSGKSTEAEIIGITDDELLPGENAARSHQEDETVMTTGKPMLDIDGKRPGPDGNPQWLLCSKVPLFDVHGEIIGLVGITHDITELKKTEQTLLLAKQEADIASKAKSEFLANMSHEIRTPLNGVIGFTDLLLKTPLNKIQKQYAENANTSGHALLGIINDILDFSKIEAGKMELDCIRTDIIELAEQTADIIKYHASRKGLELLLNIQPGIPRFAMTDPIRLKQILVNLVMNAVKFTESGEVELKVGFTKQDDKSGEYYFSVRDTGIGITREQQKQLFKAFTQADSSTTRKFGGTGLGLTISNMLAEKMGSKIDLVSEFGKGSDFSFRLKLKYHDEEKLDFSDRANLSRILVIDDNAGNCRILAETLGGWGILTTTAASGLAALEAIRKDDPYDVIIVDYHMPFHNGIETIRMIRDKLNVPTESLPAILLYLASDDGAILDECKNLGIRYSLTKPVKPQELLGYLRCIHNQPTEVAVRQGANKPQEAALISAEGGLVILIAEDVALNRFLAMTLIRQMVQNVTVVEAKSGQEAFDMAMKHHPDLILMDVQMPEMSGIEATLEIRSKEAGKESRIPIVALTAGAIKGERERCFEAGMDDFLTKPVDREALFQVLKKFLG